MAGEPSLEEIRETFSFFDDWEDRYRYVIELGQQLPELPATGRTEQNLVRGCQSQVWLQIDEHTVAGETHLSLAIDSDAFIVKGLASILLAALNGRSAANILEQNPLALFDELGLLNHLSPSRGNGLRAMIERIRAEAKQRL
ncbi:MAG: SufE family protein [Pseudomonadota bacterium]